MKKKAIILLLVCTIVSSCAIKENKTEPEEVDEVIQLSPVPTFDPALITPVPQITDDIQPTCLDHIFHTDIDNHGTPAEATIPVAYTYEEVKSYLEKEPEKYEIFEKKLHARPIMLAIEDGFYMDLNVQMTNEQISDYFFNSYLHYWDIFQGNPYPYFIMILQKGDDPELEYKFMNSRYCIPYINCHPGMSGLDIINHEIIEIWMGEGGSCMQGPEWFVVSSNVYYDLRYAPKKYLSHDASMSMAYFKPMMEESRFFGKPLNDVVGGDGYTDNDHVYAEWNGYKVLYMIDEKLCKYGLSMDNVYHQLYLEWGTNPWEDTFSSEDIQQVLLSLTGDDFSETFDNYIYNYTDIISRDYSYICHDGYIDEEASYAAVYDLENYQFQPVITQFISSPKYGDEFHKLFQYGSVVIDGRSNDWDNIDTKNRIYVKIRDTDDDAEKSKNIEEVSYFLYKDNPNIYLPILLKTKSRFSEDYVKVILTFELDGEPVSFQYRSDGTLTFSGYNSNIDPEAFKVQESFQEKGYSLEIAIPFGYFHQIDNIELISAELWGSEKGEWVLFDKVNRK